MDINQFQKASGLTASAAARWFPHITAAMQEFGIIKTDDQAMFIAQAGHESTGFSSLVESFNYSVAGLADFVRAGRITQAQANALGRRQGEPSLPLERQRALPIWSTANVWVTTGRLMVGFIRGADLSRSPV
jgi:putative chitinase